MTRYAGRPAGLAPVVVIPARLGATRLPNKPLAALGDKPMIVHVYERCRAAGIGPVIVATGDEPVANAVEAAGGRAVLTTGAHASGSDRIAEALDRYDPEARHDVIVNVQGDLPLIASETIRATLAPLAEGEADIATPVAPIAAAAEADDPNVVKAACELAPGEIHGRALYFSRQAIPWGEGAALWHHIGLYAYRRAALAAFVAASPSHLERQEKLEQLRALALGQRIEAVAVDQVPFGVDSPDDLARVRAYLDVGAG